MRKYAIQEIVKTVDCKTFEMDTSEMQELRDIFRGGVYEGIITSFKYGFLKGQRAAAKARRVKRMQQEAIV